jgi:hypothetical protein
VGQRSGERGETRVTHTLTITAADADALPASSSLQNEDPDQLAVKSQHAALPVKAGLKIAANMWLYQVG